MPGKKRRKSASSWSVGPLEHLETRRLFSAPITITSGGTYVGDWVSTNPNQAAVTIATTQPVTIENSTVQGPGNLIVTAVSGVQLTVETTTGTGENPNVAGLAAGEFLEADNTASLAVENNVISNVGGYAIDVHGFTGTGSQTIHICYNSISNIDGQFSNGAAGYENNGQPAPHAIILNGIQSVAGIQIAWNQIINQPGQSYVNDVVNIYNSSGTAASPIAIHQNYIDGLYAINPATQYDSGSGIITDGTAGAGETAYVNIYNNDIVSTGNAGIAIAAGHNVVAYDNQVLASGYEANGTSVYSTNVGIYIWDQMIGGNSGNFYSDGAYDNTVGWVQPPNSNSNPTGGAVENDWWLPDATGSLTYGNTDWGGSVTYATQTNEFTVWEANMTSHDITVGLLLSSGSTTGTLPVTVTVPISTTTTTTTRTTTTTTTKPTTTTTTTTAKPTTTTTSKPAIASTTTTTPKPALVTSSTAETPAAPEHDWHHRHHQT